MSTDNARILQFTKPEPEAYAAAISGAISDGVRLVRMYPDSAAARELTATLRLNLPNDVRLESVRELPDRVSAESNEIDGRLAYLLIPEREGDLPDLLLRFLDWVGGWLIAPQTDRYYARNPLFLVSIPKAGTHLLYNLARKMGYRDGVELIGFPEPAHWYCLEYSNSHTAALDFFIDTVRRSPLGNRAHPFPRTPTLMIYRNPLDILVSEANWYHRDGKASFHGYFSGLSFEERVERLISDPWLLGSIRERVGKFLAWLEFPNVIPLSFEELVGTRGGGNDRVCIDLIWSLQLKLQVPGRPEDIAEGLFDPDSPTFNEGRIHRYRDLLSERAFSKFNSLDQDFMRSLGYAGYDETASLFPPRRAEEFRRRPLHLGSEDQNEAPHIMEVFLGCNLVRFRQRFYALPRHLGVLDLTTLAPEKLESFTSTKDLGELKNLLLLGQEAYNEALRRASATVSESAPPRLLFEDYRDFNLIDYDGKVWAAAIAAGPVDLLDTELRRRLIAEGTLLEALTVDGALGAVDRFHARQEMEVAVAGLSSRFEAAVSSVQSAIDGKLSKVERLMAQQVSVIGEIEESHRNINAKLIQAEAVISQLSLQQMEIANRHDAELLQLKQSQNEIETDIDRVQAVIREHSSGFLARLKRWIRSLFGRSAPSVRKAADK